MHDLLGQNLIRPRLVQNLCARSKEHCKQIKPFRTSLRDVPMALERNHNCLLADGVFDEGQIADWISLELNEEYYQVMNHPLPYEVALYLDVRLRRATTARTFRVLFTHVEMMSAPEVSARMEQYLR